MRGKKMRDLAMVIALIAIPTVTLVVGLQGVAGASDPDATTPSGAVIEECLDRRAGNNVTIFGQVWNDADGDEQLLGDIGIEGVEVALDLTDGTDSQTAVTDSAGFWVFCLETEFAATLMPSIDVAIPDGRALVTPGVGNEDADSDVVPIDNAGTVQQSGTTEPFSVADELRGRDRRFESSRELLTIRIDVGLAEEAPFRPCPDWTPEFLEIDPDGDWDGDGIPNIADSLPCDEGIANPCPNFAEGDREFDPQGDWDGDGIVNIEDQQPCTSFDPPPPNPCDNPSAAERDALAQQSPAEDWDDDGLVNDVDPTPCETGVGNPCPEWQQIHREFDPAGDWDGDGIVNAEDELPCNSEPLNPCPDVGRELADQFPNLDWDGDGIGNGGDPLPCDPPRNPCPNANDLWIQQEPGADWDDDGILNIEDAEPCVQAPQNPCAAGSTIVVDDDPLGDWDEDGIVNVEDVEPCVQVALAPCDAGSSANTEDDPLGDWDGDNIVNIEDERPCEPDEGGTPCPRFAPEDVERDPLSDWDGDGVVNSEDPAPCDPNSPNSTTTSTTTATTAVAAGVCPGFTDEQLASEPLADWDGDEVVNSEDPEPCDPEIPDNVDRSCLAPSSPDTAVDESLDSDDDGIPDVDDVQPCVPEDGGGLPVIPLVVVGTVLTGLVGTFWARNRSNRDDDDDDETEERKRKPKASIAGVEVS